jgi:hypothetical protein
LKQEVTEGEGITTLPLSYLKITKKGKDNVNTDTMFSSVTPEWYTPPNIIKLVLEMFDGEIDLDPCSNLGVPNIPAKKHYTKNDNGLWKDWYGKVYVNPPYGRELNKWVSHMVKQSKAGHMNEGILLCPARTDTKWFQLLQV